MSNICKQLRVILITILFGAMPVLSQSSQDVSSIDRAGTTAGQFLKIGAGARAIGLGSAYTALTDDILSIYWNPAGLSRVRGNGEATFNHAEWLAETSYDFAAFSMNLGSFGALGIHITSLSVPEEPVRTIDNPDGTGQFWDATMISGGVSYALSLTEDFSIGFTGKFVQEKIFNQTARGAAVDLGVLYRTPFRRLWLGAAISNFGTKMQLDGRDLYINYDPFTQSGGVSNVPSKYRLEKFELPLTMRFGLALEAYKNDDITVLAVADGVQPNDNGEYLNSGLEVGVKNTIFLRGGYKSLMMENSEQGLTFGAGIRYDAAGTNLKFDFGWADYGRLDNVQFVSFTVRY
ncbi:MAG: PorV/PorQ family protein [Calditrichaeota bacterium]|nr:PorV/PorQ family protein [Calditrichota bacterium]MCB9068985.1 PorV/PorQ family protein [Calditrichia bacterium]